VTAALDLEVDGVEEGPQCSGGEPLFRSMRCWCRLAVRALLISMRRQHWPTTATGGQEAGKQRVGVVASCLELVYEREREGTVAAHRAWE